MNQTSLLNGQHASASADWYSPPEIVEPARALWPIDLDPASCPIANDVVKASRIFTSAEDGFGERWGYGSFEIVNPFALIATDPNALIRTVAANIEWGIGTENDAHIQAAAERAIVAVIAWGGDVAHRLLKPRADAVLAKLRASGLLLRCLEPTKDGFPRHPSRAAYSTPLVPFGGGA